MRQFLLLCASMLLLAPLHGQTWAEPESYTCSPVVKVHIPAWEENGSGLLIGWQGQTAYILTAAHVVADPDEEDMPLPEEETLHVKVQEYNSEGTRGSEGKLPATVRYFDPKLDLAVLSIDWSALPPGQSGAAMQPPVTAHGFLAVSECIKGEMATLRGFSGGSQTQQDHIELMIQGAIYYGDEKAFRMEAENVEGGHSGAPVFNSLGEWIGLMAKRNGTGTACKVIKAETILTILQTEGLPANGLRPPTLSGKWQLAGMVERGSGTLLAFPPTLDALSIDAYGQLSGLSTGTACINNGKVSFTGLPDNALMLLPIRPPGASSNLHRAVLEEIRSYSLQKQYHPLFPDQLSTLKLLCDQYEIWLHPVP